MKLLSIIALLSVLVSCTNDEAPGSGYEGDGNLPIITMELEKISGKSIFEVALNVKSILEGKTEDRQKETMEMLEEKYFINCENLKCKIEKKD